MIQIPSDLAWSPFDIPGGNEPVQMALLQHDPTTRARTVVVSFPPGWKRGEIGSYVAAEELVLLEGTLNMNGALWRAGDWAYIGAKGMRREMYTDDGALAYARFLGPAKWLVDEGDDIAFDHAPLSLEGITGGSSLGAPATLLRSNECGSAWLIGALSAGARAERPIEILALDSRTYAEVAVGDGLPSFDEPSFCRILGGSL